MSAGQFPLIQIGGNPSSEEIAAVVAAVTALAAQSAAAATAMATDPISSQVAGWAARRPRLRQPINPGPAGWRQSAR